MTTFNNTFLYIKQHSITGLLYFGKTTKDPEVYIGSGKLWTRHINKHGKEHVVTLWYCLFTDQNDLNDFAIQFSTQHDIVDSSLWANLAIENGTDGGARINNHFKIWSKLPKSEEIKTKISQSQCGLTNKGGQSRRIRCQVEEHIFNSIREAGRFYNVGEMTVHSWLKTGKAIRLN